MEREFARFMPTTIPPDKMPLKHEAIPLPSSFVGGKPAFLLDREARILSRTETQQGVAFAARCMFELLRPSLGPAGMLKMLVGEKGFIRITKDGGALLDQMQLEHPVLRILKELGLSVKRSVGDGVLRSVILASRLVEEAFLLHQRGVGKAVVVEGFSLAAEECLKRLQFLAVPVNPSDKNQFERILGTVIGNSIPVDEATAIAYEFNKHFGQKADFDIDKVYFRKARGGSFSESRVVHGVVFMKEIPHSDMPTLVRNARVAVIGGDLRVKTRGRTRSQEHSFVLDDGHPYSISRAYKRDYFAEMVDRVERTGANVLLVEKGVDPMALEMLARRGILVIRRFSWYDLAHIAEAIGGKMVAHELLEPEHLAQVESVEMKTIGENTWWFMDGCEASKACEVLLRGFSEEFMDEAERSMKKGAYALRSIYEDPRVLPAGGATEMFLARMLRQQSREFGNRIQLVFESCAKVLEEIPSALVENSGSSALDILLELSAYHAQGKSQMGFNSATGKIDDVVTAGLLDPFTSVRSLTSASFETAIGISQIDQIILDKELVGPEFYYRQRMEKSSPENMKKRE